jgi:hypothetical protein
MLGFAWRCSSLTHAFAFSNEDCPEELQRMSINLRDAVERGDTNSFGDIIDYHCGCCITVVHWRKRMEAF